jgi:hypothetical protein
MVGRLRARGFAERRWAVTSARALSAGFLVAICIGLAVSPPARADSGSGQPVEDINSIVRLAPGQATPPNPQQLALPASADVPPPGHTLSFRQAVQAAQTAPKLAALAGQFPQLRPIAFTKGSTQWEVVFGATDRGPEVGVAVVDDASARVLSAYTGIQIRFQLARAAGYGGILVSWWFWLPLCALFALPLADWRRWRAWRNLDLAVLLSFSVPLAFFNHADVRASVLLVYPPLLYLLARMLSLARRRPRDGDETLQLAVPVRWLAYGCVALAAGHVALSIADSSISDVGAASVLGAHKLLLGKPLYGHWPTSSFYVNGDTYGPAVYALYAPFEAALGLTNTTVRVAALAADLLTAVCLFFLGRRVRGTGLGVILAYGWLAFPFTAYALESNTNDLLVGLLVSACLLFAASPPARGALTALAGLTKFAPLALAPLMALADRPRRWRSVLVFSAVFVATIVVAFVPVVAHSSLHEFYDRTLGFQLDRQSPFSVWKVFGIQPDGSVTEGTVLTLLQKAVQFGAIALALALAVLPRREDRVGLAAASAAILVATQLGVTHWFYFYLPWLLGAVLLAVFGSLSEPEADPAPAAQTRPRRSSKPPPRRVPARARARA